MLVATFSLLLLVIMIFSSMYIHLKKEEQISLTRSANYISELIEDNIYIDSNQIKFSDSMIIQNVLNTFHVSSNINVIITDQNGNILLNSGFGNKTNKFYKGNISPDIVEKVLTVGEYFFISSLDNLLARDSNICALAISTNINNQNKNIACVFVCSDVHDASFIKSNYLSLFLLALLLSLMCAFVFSFYFSSRLIQPLKKMSKATKAFAQGDFSVRVDDKYNDEIGDLAKTFNNMASSVEAFESVRRSFVCNLSHELKTPMTTICGFIDGILDGTIPKEKQDYYLNIVSQEIKRLSRLVKTMQTLSLIDSNNMRLNITNVNLTDIIISVFAMFEEKLREKNINLHGIHELCDIKVKADYDMIYQVFYNIIENAVKFTNSNGYIQINVRYLKNDIVIDVKNSGNTISDNELAFIFDKFYKSDKSRSIDTKGMGLGLYISKNIMHLHTGDITVKSKENEYCVFSLWFNSNF